MLTKTITYTDYDGNKRTEEFCFNLSKAEVTQMELSVNGGMSGMLQKIVQTQDHKQIVDVFRDIIMKSYGEKTADGRRFIKSPEISEAFSQTEAFSDLFMELATNHDAAAAFINGIIPAVPEDQKAAAKKAQEDMKLKMLPPDPPS